jgi:hypothetical protein
VLTFNEEWHEYYVNGVRVPGVTELVSILGEDYDSDDALREATIAAATERGITMHGYLEHRLLGGDPEEYEIPGEYSGYAEAVELFLAEHEFEPWLIETPMDGEASGAVYAGTPDFVGVFDGKATILDYKFVSSVAKTKVGAQLNGYQGLCLQNDINVEKLIAVQFMRDGTYRLYPARMENFDFLLCIEVWKAKNKKHLRGEIA